MKKSVLFAILLLTCAGAQAQKRQPLSRSFELRYVTADPAADGETDFKGETDWFDTSRRIEYLQEYVAYASRFFEDPTLAEQVVSEAEVVQAMAALKPQPLPQVRRTLRLQDWAAYGYQEGQDAAARQRIAFWNAQNPAVSVQGGVLRFSYDATLALDIPEQTWRYRFEFSLSGEGNIAFTDSRSGRAVIRAGLREGRAFFVTDGRTAMGPAFGDGTHACILEVDLTAENRRYNFTVDGRTVADFEALADPLAARTDRLELSGSAGAFFDALWGVGYTPTARTDRLNMPYYVSTFLDDAFEQKPSAAGWTRSGFDDSLWERTDLPRAHGSERHAGEDLYLRKVLHVDAFERAWFELESIFPSGELWINGRVAEVIRQPHPQMIEVTDWLKPGEDNIIALKINSFSAPEEQMMHHCPTDPNIGWFAGRAALHLTAPVRITDVYVYTQDLRDGNVRACAEVTVENAHYTRYRGEIRLLLKEWFPAEAPRETDAAGLEIALEPQQKRTFKLIFDVPGARLWSAADPQLYQIRSLLVNAESGTRTEIFRALDGDEGIRREVSAGRYTDDFVITTGFRTVDQNGGTFRINRKHELLRAPLIFGQRFPLERLATDLLCSSSEDMMRELLAIKKMGGNGARMSVHWSNNYGRDGTNDPRWLEMADQLGLMYAWTTASWTRVYSPFTTDFAGMEKDVRQARNAPSIVIWQTANHPDLSRWDDAMVYFNRVYDIIYPLDTTRLITPTADLRHIGPHNDDGTLDNEGQPDPACDPVWTAHRIARGSMDYPTGFGQDWEYLRRWPFPLQWKGNVPINDYLQSPVRAYFNFEQEESIGQMNWDLYKGSPVYKYHSYEWDYDEGSIGRLLEADEWRESQAWQAFSAYECIRKMRWLDYDGLSWCCMWGGPNMGTYQKPLIDALGNKKLAFYTHRMGFQDLLAGSGDVDIVYGPGDRPALLVLGLGVARRVDIVLTVRNDKGRQVLQHRYRDIRIEAGRTAREFSRLELPKLPDGFYFFEYTILEHR